VSKPSFFQKARQAYHLALLESGVLCISKRAKSRGDLPQEVPSNADADSASSIAIAQAIFDQIQSEIKVGVKLAGQMAGNKFEHITRSYVEKTFAALKHIRPGKWDSSPAKREIWSYEQYHHLAELSELAKKYEELAVHLGHKSDYVIAPDILLVREPEPDQIINADQVLVDDSVAKMSALRGRYNKLPLLHASISCKWTLRSDRAQNARSEALNLIRNRKGRVPNIVVVTGEPLPSRLASLALGTGDLDCVYHFALPELIASVQKLGAEDSVNMVKIMTDGKRLKDISDLPLDLAV
jgi:hypothetical protein